MVKTQSARNHAKLDPPFHFFVAPVLLINALVTAVVMVTHSDHLLLHTWLFVVALALLMLAGVARSSALRAQDRVIRLEEMLRYQRLFGPEELAAAQALQLRQVIALRFASDAELPTLVRRVLAEGMPPKAIKEAIVSWRADIDRV